MICKFCNGVMNAVYTCGDDGKVKKFFRCPNCHSETKPMFFDSDLEFKQDGRKNNSMPKKKRKTKTRKNNTKGNI